MSYILYLTSHYYQRFFTRRVGFRMTESFFTRPLPPEAALGISPWALSCRFRRMSERHPGLGDWLTQPRQGMNLITPTHIMHIRRDKACLVSTRLWVGIRYGLLKD